MEQPKAGSRQSFEKQKSVEGWWVVEQVVVRWGSIGMYNTRL